MHISFQIINFVSSHLLFIYYCVSVPTGKRLSTQIGQFKEHLMKINVKVFAGHIKTQRIEQYPKSSYTVDIEIESEDKEAVGSWSLLRALAWT